MHHLIINLPASIKYYRRAVGGAGRGVGDTAERIHLIINKAYNTIKSHSSTLLGARLGQL